MNRRWGPAALRPILFLSFFAASSLLLMLHAAGQGESWRDVAGTYRKQHLEEQSRKLAFLLRDRLSAGPVNAGEKEQLDQAGRLFGASIRYTGPEGVPEWHTSRTQPYQTDRQAELYTVELPLIYGGEELGRLTMTYDLRSDNALRNLTTAEEQLERQRQIVLAVLLAAAAVVAWIASRLLAKPFLVLTAATDKIAAGGRDLTVPASGISETKRIAAVLNKLLKECGEQERWRQRMMQDLMHELRTPLTSILHRLEAMQDGVYPISDANLAKMYAELDRLSRFVDDMNKLSEAEAARFQLRPKRTDLSELTRSVWEGFQFLARENSIELTFSPCYEPCVVDVDPDRIVQVVSNLLSNALKYTQPGGRVEVGVRFEGHAVALTCRDNGIGISEEELPNVFRRFYRAGKSASGSRGLGVGLSIVRALVNAHGGTVSAESAPGEGSVFTVILPASAGTAVAETWRAKNTNGWVPGNEEEGM